MADPVVINLDLSFDDSSIKSKHTLVGKILSKRPLNQKGVANIIGLAWRTKEEVSVSAWGDNLYAFGFKSEEDLCKIITLGPWSIMGNLMVLRKWESHKTIEEMDFSCSPFWVQIQGLPLGFMNVSSGMKIAESLGEVIAVEDPDARSKMAKYIRVRVWLDLSKPLSKGFFLKRAEEDDLWVKFKYERLSDFCYGCGRIGHSVNDCTELGFDNEHNRVFDGTLRADISGLDTIQFGDSQVEKHFYPHSKKTTVKSGVVDGGEPKGGACNRAIQRTEEGTKRIQAGTEILMGDILDAVHDTSGQTSSTERMTPPTATNVAPGMSAELATCKSLDIVGSCFNHGPVQHPLARPPIDPLPVIGKRVLPSSVEAHYFVEEPVSPRADLGLSVEACFDNPMTLSPKPNPKNLDVGLSTVFDRLLNLKRKHSLSPEEPPTKKPTLLLDWGKVSGDSVGVSDGGNYSPSQGSPYSGGSRITRGRGNGRNISVKSSGRKKGVSFHADEVQNLVEVHVAHSSEMDLSVNNSLVVDSSVLDPIDKAPVAGLKQPRTQW